VTPKVDLLGKQCVARPAILDGFIGEMDAIDFRQLNGGLELVSSGHGSLHLRQVFNDARMRHASE